MEDAAKSARRQSKHTETMLVRHVSDKGLVTRVIDNRVENHNTVEKTVNNAHILPRKTQGQQIILHIENQHLGAWFCGMMGQATACDATIPFRCRFEFQLFPCSSQLICMREWQKMVKGLGPCTQEGQLIESPASDFSLFQLIHMRHYYNTYHNT